MERKLSLGEPLLPFTAFFVVNAVDQVVVEDNTTASLALSLLLLLVYCFYPFSEKNRGQSGEPPIGREMDCPLSAKIA